MQLRSLLSGHDALTILEIEHSSLNCGTKAAFSRLFARIKELFSFDCACAILGYRHDNAAVFIDAVDISYDPDFYRLYKSKDGLRTDLIANSNFKNYAVQYWSIDKKRPAQSKEMLSLAVDFGTKTGYAHGSKPFGSQRFGSLFTFAGTAIKPEARTATILELIIPHLHLSLSQIHQRKQYVDHSIVLSQREREVLNWVQQGKSSWDISVILRISERTVNFHIYNIMHKLCVVNRSQMVAVAVRQGLIDIN